MRVSKTYSWRSSQSIFGHKVPAIKFTYRVHCIGHKSITHPMSEKVLDKSKYFTFCRLTWKVL